MLPFQANQATATPQAPATAATPQAPYNPFAQAATAEVFDSTPPKPGHGTYLVKIDRLVNNKGKFLITEYTIVKVLDDSSEASPVGFRSSQSQILTTNECWSYITKQTLTQLGYQPTSQEAQGVKPYIPAIILAETTGQAQPGPGGQMVEPGAIKGKIVGLAITPNIDPQTGELVKNKKGKYYPKETYFVAPAQ